MRLSDDEADAFNIHNVDAKKQPDFSLKEDVDDIEQLGERKTATVKMTGGKGMQVEKRAEE